MTALLDTGFLLAVLDADDDLHSVCAQGLSAESEPILPDMVLPELAYMIFRELGYDVLLNFLLGWGCRTSRRCVAVDGEQRRRPDSRLRRRPAPGPPKKRAGD